MKKQCLLFVFILLCSALHSQDLIVTTNHDSINCQILVIDNEVIHFSFIKDNEKIKTSLPFDQVLSSSLGYYANSGSDYVAYPKDKNYARFRVALAGGYSCRTFTIPEGTSLESKNYQNKARNGFHYGMELNYYFHRFIGIGINYYADHFNPEGNFPEMSNYLIHISTKTRFQQITPTFNVRVLDRQRRGALVAGIGLGYTDYITKFYRTNDSYGHIGTEKGWTVGMLWNIGYDIPLSQTMAIYVRAALNAGVVTNITMIDEITGKTETISVDDVNNGVGLGKMSLSVGVRFAN
jgi:hypothetical protein